MESVKRRALLDDKVKKMAQCLTLFHFHLQFQNMTFKTIFLYSHEYFPM